MEMKTWRAYQIVDKELRRRLIDTDTAEYADALDKIVSMPPSPQTRSTLGLVSPSATTPDLFHHSTQNTVLFTARLSERILPRAVVVDEVAKRGARLLRQEGEDRKELSRKEFAQLRDAAVAELLPKSHVKHKLIPILLRGQYLVIGASSTKVCEDILNKFRFAFGTLKVIPFQTKVPATDIMRRMLGGVLEQDELADIELRLGSRAKLDHKEGAQVTVKGEDLRGDHVTTLIDDDYYPIELSMSGYRDGNQVVKFVVNKAWVFKSFKSTIDPEDVNDSHFGDDPDAEWRASMARFDANLILLADSVFTTIDTVVDAAGALELKEIEIAVRDMWGSLNKAEERESKQHFSEDGRRGDTPVWILDEANQTVTLGTLADLADQDVGLWEITGGYEQACRLRVEHDLPPMDKDGVVIEETVDEDLDDL